MHLYLLTASRLALSALALWFSLEARAEAPKTGRDEFQDAYKKQLANTPSLFDSVPISHIIPAENTITFALALDYKDVTIAPHGQDISGDRSNLPERLDYKGLSASPYFALSSKHFGFGFTGEVGQLQAKYKRDPSLATAGNPATGGYLEETGKARYSGIGLFLYVSPTWHALPKTVTLNLVFGGRSLNVQHETSGSTYSPDDTAQTSKVHYTVQNLETGVNVGLHFVKNCTIIPWIDYAANLVKGSGTAAAGQGRSIGLDDPVVKSDVDLFWHSAPPLRYGIDFALRLGNFDIHLGGLLGFLGNLEKGADRIQDQSHYMSISLDSKG